jgi:hypothetical protein
MIRFSPRLYFASSAASGVTVETYPGEAGSVTFLTPESGVVGVGMGQPVFLIFLLFSFSLHD